MLEQDLEALSDNMERIDRGAQTMFWPLRVRPNGARPPPAPGWALFSSFGLVEIWSSPECFTLAMDVGLEELCHHPTVRFPCHDCGRRITASQL